MAQDFTVDRNSSKWVLGDSGVLVEYATDEPAIEFNADGSYKGVLVEPASTQLLGGDTHTPTTQTVIVTAAEHTLSFYGTGSVVLSGAATGTLTGSGTSAERVSLTFTPSAGSLTLTVSGSPEYWQLEVSPIATSYIRNTGAVGTSVTRVKDEIYITGASSLIGQTEGTLFIEVDWQDISTSTNRFLLSINEGVVGNRIVIRREPTGIGTFVATDGSTRGILSYSFSGYDGIVKIAVPYKTDDYAIFVNGVNRDSDNTVDLSYWDTNPSLTNVNLGQAYNEALQANMHIRTVAIYKTRLSDAECEALTT